jgi:3-deoxy-manno-octulosonate cytidylyltransferase (CMP-KDO synthetase)
MKAIGIIPARYKSSRFPGKPLISILGKPLIIHVAEKVEAALGRDNTIIATEDERIQKVVTEYGYKVVMTDSSHPTGTDRLYEVATKNKADIYLNIQGDEPMVKPEDIIMILEKKKLFHNYIINGMCPLSPHEDPASINIPKVVVSLENDLLYMSRLAIPGIKDPSLGIPIYRKQVCIYAFNFQELEGFALYKKKMYNEQYEDIEILRFLELGFKVKMIETSGASLAVDVPDDVFVVENALKARSK